MADSVNLDLQELGWEELRKEVRKIEGDLDIKLSSYAKLAIKFTYPTGHIDNGSQTVVPDRSWKPIEMEIQSLLEKLLDINDAMSQCAASTSSTSSVYQKLSRHMDILHEFTQEFRRTKGRLHSARERAELLNSVQDDIGKSKASESLSSGVNLLHESASIHGSTSHIDELICQAQATRSVLGGQRALIGDVEGKVEQLGEKFPKIRGILGAIRRKRSRDTLILSAVIAACTLFLIIYWLVKRFSSHRSSSSIETYNHPSLISMAVGILSSLQLA